LTIARRALRRAVAPGDTIIAAVSGGPDSMAMLHVLATLAHEFPFVVIAHGVDHGLRREAAQELALAASLAERLRVPFTQTRVSLSRGGNVQARARAARIDALDRVRLDTGARFVATAHHADDRAETVLLRLVRGSSLSGLGVLPLVDGSRLRPLIEARKSDINAHLARHAIAFATDPSNADPRFLRARVRQDLLPALLSLNPRIVEGLTSLADEARLLPRENALPRATRPRKQRVRVGL
jgi:tRNA(Ile)-lysidine synthase